jgi:hypothetical protein
LDAEDRNGKQAAMNSAGILAFIIGFVIASKLLLSLHLLSYLLMHLQKLNVIIQS